MRLPLISGWRSFSLLGFTVLLAAPCLAAERAPQKPAFATVQGFSDEAYFTIESVSIEEVETPAELLFLLPGEFGMMAAPHWNAAFELPSLSEMINIGKEVWQIVTENKPVVSFSADAGATIVPQGITNWMELQGWQMPQSRSYRVRAKNFYGLEVIDFTANVVYTYGGNIRGKGQYLSGVQVVPTNITTAWGYTFNAKATVANVTNAGTHDDPIAAIQLQLHWDVTTVLKHQESTSNYYVRGDGQFAQFTMFR